jgi:tetratricopeptide (TPR) repeat protein
MQGFADYARYLQHPLVLIGFLLLLFFGVHRALLRSGILPPLTAQSGSKVVHALLRYGFIIALAIIVLGFALEFFKAKHAALTPEHLKVLATLNEAYDRSTHARELHYSERISEQERRNAAASTREIEDLMSKAGIKLSPQQLTGFGFLYMVTNELDKAKTALLEAITDDPSMGEPNALLAVVTQLQANDQLQKGDLNGAQETLSMAEHYAQEARRAFPDDTSMDNQLAYIYKDIAQQEFDQNDQSNALKHLEKARKLFERGLKSDPNDPSPHNGLGSVYYLSGDLDRAIEEQQAAIKLYPRYTFAWHDLAVALQQKYLRDKPPNAATLAQLNEAVDKVFELQQTPVAQKLPPASLAAMEDLRTWVQAQTGKLPKKPVSDGATHLNVSGVGSPAQTRAIESALAQYYGYLRTVGFTVPEGTVQVQITPANNQYLSYYDPSKDTIFYSVQYADSTFWPLRDYTFRALGEDERLYQRPALVAIMSGLATYYPSSFRNNPNYGPDYGGHLDKFRSLGELRPELQSASSDGSSIWGSICWELRTMLERDATDTLLLQA